MMLKILDTIIWFVNCEHVTRDLWRITKLTRLTQFNLLVVISTVRKLLWGDEKKNPLRKDLSPKTKNCFLWDCIVWIHCILWPFKVPSKTRNNHEYLTHALHTFPLHPCSLDKSRQHVEASCWAVPPGLKNFARSSAGLDSLTSLMQHCPQWQSPETTELWPHPDPVVDLEDDWKCVNTWSKTRTVSILQQRKLKTRTPLTTDCTYNMEPPLYLPLVWGDLLWKFRPKAYAALSVLF